MIFGSMVLMNWSWKGPKQKTQTNCTKTFKKWKTYFWIGPRKVQTTESTARGRRRSGEEGRGPASCERPWRARRSSCACQHYGTRSCHLTTQRWRTSPSSCACQSPGAWSCHLPTQRWRSNPSTCACQSHWGNFRATCQRNIGVQVLRQALAQLLGCGRATCHHNVGVQALPSSVRRASCVPRLGLLNQHSHGEVSNPRLLSSVRSWTWKKPRRPPSPCACWLVAQESLRRDGGGTRVYVDSQQDFTKLEPSTHQCCSRTSITTLRPACCLLFLSLWSACVSSTAGRGNWPATEAGGTKWHSWSARLRSSRVSQVAIVAYTRSPGERDLLPEPKKTTRLWVTFRPPSCDPHMGAKRRLEGW